MENSDLLVVLWLRVREVTSRSEGGDGDVDAVVRDQRDLQGKRPKDEKT